MDEVLGGLLFGESPRWHEGQLYVSDWGAGQVLRLTMDGRAEVMAEKASFPLCIDFLPDGRMLLVSAADRQLLVREADGILRRYADLGESTPWNDIVVDARGTAYVNNIGFDFPAGPGSDGAPGIIVRVSADGHVRTVADNLAFPNGMVVTPDNRTLIVAESYADRLSAYDIAANGDLSGRRVWAPLPEGAAPDGICLDSEGAVWFASVPGRSCTRVAEGGEVFDVVPLDRGAFACALSRGADPQLFIVATRWNGVEGAGQGRTGQVLAVPAPFPAAT